MSRMTLIGSVAAVVLAAAAGAATAQQAPAPQAPAQAGGHDRAARMQAADTDNNGRISQAEFSAKAVERLRSADGNGDGTVTAEERRAAGEARRAEHMAERFARLDTNSDGAISRAEFEAAPAARGDRQGRRGGRGEGRGEGMRGRAHDAGNPGGGHRGMRGMRGEARMGQAGEPVTIAQAQASAAERFARMDVNNDGYLTAEDRTAAQEARGERRQERRERMQQRRAARAAQASPAATTSE